VISWFQILAFKLNLYRYISGFGLGASAVALFARVAGGIYAKAADVGADLVGKVESDIAEDAPMNPATVADNVGVNVGGVVGMGADLFESFVGAIIACASLATTVGLYKLTHSSYLVDP
jgi:K(+)-stimulated pyrophosphate-energized sodium pump